MKNNLKQQIRKMLSDKPGHIMKIFIQAKPSDEPKYYEQIPCDNDVSVCVTSEEAADSLIEFLSDLTNAASANPKINKINYIIPEEETST